MSVLKDIYASPDNEQYLIHAIKIEIASLVPIYVCDGFENLVLGGNLHEAGNISVSLPRRAKSGAQKLNFGIWNAYGKAIDYVDKALESREVAYVTYYQYLDSDLDNPIQETKPMNIITARFSNNTAVFEAQYHDMLNTKFPREYYNDKTAAAIQFT